MADNDNTPTGGGYRLVSLIGAVHDDGRVEHYGAPSVLRVPLEALEAPVWSDGNPQS